MKPNSKIYRTQVIWKPERLHDDDPEDNCPIDCKIFIEWCNLLKNAGYNSKKALLLIVSAAAVFVLLSTMGSAYSVSESAYDVKLQHSWNADEQSLDHMHEIGLLHIKNAIPLPQIVDDNIANVDEPLQDGDVTYFFHIPRTAGASVKDVSLVIFFECVNTDALF